MKTLHRQVAIVHRGRAAKVDEGIAPLIVALWRRGFRTISSCEHQPGTPVAWVGFASLGDAKKAARIIGGRLLVPKPEDYAQASAKSFEAGYSRPGAAGVAIPCDGIREAADRALRPRKSPARRRVRRP